MIKVMSRSVQLGVSAIQIALDESENWETVPPERRGMYVGTTPLGGDPKDLLPALDVSTAASGELSMSEFATKGYERIHPLWLIRGLSNNILGLAAAIHNFQGVNANYCSGDRSGAIALMEAYWAVAESRADLVVAGAADAMVEFSEKWMGLPGGEGAAFFVLRASNPADSFRLSLDESPKRIEEGVDVEENLGYLGATGGVVGLARRLFSDGQASMTLENNRVLRIFR